MASRPAREELMSVPKTGVMLFNLGVGGPSHGVKIMPDNVNMRSANILNLGLDHQISTAHLPEYLRLRTFQYVLTTSVSAGRRLLKQEKRSTRSNTVAMFSDVITILYIRPEYTVA